ncbi:hypothetical protein LTR78_002079 [Recurvomyces mirabilis]|uniref:Xylanolytic transcriptional activator regulatory domain-containing protein n=1 Tax=Recurvomyces mirabilis TaxID=574656 RepID=A0AAE0WTP0_9PEZI|nr:hypothetical protein LTR78_002079 [Recurvomyces mirabilis]KAK5160537.1 hypothetical protein LTS14_001549 [Recurvomyces mirabilis]
MADLDSSAASSRPPASPEFLLAFLALTARFHSKLVAHHHPPSSSRPSNPLIACQYYAVAANERLATSWTDNRVHDIERIQAALMIGLHEWSMCRGAKAWLTIGIAIRAAQAMGLQYERELDDEPMSRALALGSEAERMGLDSRKGSLAGSKGEEDAFVQQEIRRRTFWSCYIMDRYLSSGKYRPQMLHAHELRIQLPASERSFLFGEKVRTLMLGEEERVVEGRAELQNHRQAFVAPGKSLDGGRKMSISTDLTSANDDERGRLETGVDEGLVSRYVKILKLYGRVVQWSCAGGRRIEEHPPWDRRCQWNRLRQQCWDFRASLPRQHTLTPQNTQAHISMKTSTPYALVHIVYLLCNIMLHREYVPFLPIRCNRPVGPLDAPMFPPDRYDVPSGFWEESATELFRCAREIMDLVRSCQEWSALVETPIVGFAIYTVAFVGVYSINFTHMDREGYMCTPPAVSSTMKMDGDRSGGSKGFEAAKKALEMVGHMRPRLRMADGWFTTITRMHKYFRRMRSDYRKNVVSTETSSSEDDSGSTVARSLREGGPGGGLDEWKLLERTIKDFGNLDDYDIEMDDADPAQESRPGDALNDDSGSAGTTVKSEDRDTRKPMDQKAESGGPWNAINATSGATLSRQQSMSTPNSAQFRTYDSYPSQYHTSHPPTQQQPTPQGSLPPPSYSTQNNGFRPAYSGELSISSGPPPTLVSPASHSSTTPSQASPLFDRQLPSYAGWTPQHAPYPPMQHAQSAYPPGTHHYQHAPMPMQQPFASPHQPSQHQHQHIMPIQQHYTEQPPVQQQVWDEYQKEAWLNGLQTRMSADDLAAFVNGGDIAEWASREQFGSTPGWLNTLYGMSSI